MKMNIGFETKENRNVKVCESMWKQKNPHWADNA